MFPRGKSNRLLSSNSFLRRLSSSGSKRKLQPDSETPPSQSPGGAASTVVPNSPSSKSSIEETPQPSPENIVKSQKPHSTPSQSGQSKSLPDCDEINSNKPISRNNSLNNQAKQPSSSTDQKSMGKVASSSAEKTVPDDKFEFSRMVQYFEKVTFPIPQEVRLEKGGLPHTWVFLNAMSQVCLLFDQLGAAFGFVKRDIEMRTKTIGRYADEDPPGFHDLEHAVNREISNGQAFRKNQDKNPSTARTLLRLIWALKFIDVLLEHLKKAMDPDSDLPQNQRTFKAAVSIAYNEALAEHHNWAMRQTVGAAFNLLPSMHDFVHKIGAKPEYLERLGKSMTPMVASMYKFYGQNNILKLP